MQKIFALNNFLNKLCSQRDSSRRLRQEPGFNVGISKLVPSTFLPWIFTVCVPRVRPASCARPDRFAVLHESQTRTGTLLGFSAYAYTFLNEWKICITISLIYRSSRSLLLTDFYLFLFISYFLPFEFCLLYYELLVLCALYPLSVHSHLLASSKFLFPVFLFAQSSFSADWTLFQENGKSEKLSERQRSGLLPVQKFALQFALKKPSVLVGLKF